MHLEKLVNTKNSEFRRQQFRLCTEKHMSACCCCILRSCVNKNKDKKMNMKTRRKRKRMCMNLTSRNDVGNTDHRNGANRQSLERENFNFENIAIFNR